MEKEFVKQRYENFPHFVFALCFCILVAIAIWLVMGKRGLPLTVPVMDFVLLSLAVYRLTRLIVHDKVAEFIRDWAYIRHQITLPSGEVIIEKCKPEQGYKRAISNLLECPWCTGMWFALITVTAYFLTPIAWYIILLLAVAAVASTLQVLSDVFVSEDKILKAERKEAAGSLPPIAKRDLTDDSL